MIPLKINGKHLVEIFDPVAAASLETDEAKERYSIKKQMYPTSVELNAEVYSRDAERTANYELEDLVLVNRKVKPIFTWDYIKADYIVNLLTFLGYKTSYKDNQGDIIPEDAPTYSITFWDLTGERTITAYLGQTIECELKEYNINDISTLYWENFRIAFPEV